MSLRTAWYVCKNGARRPRALLLAVIVSACWQPSCKLGPEVQRVSLAELEAAPPANLATLKRVTVANADALRALCAPLGPRLGLLQVQSPAEWIRLQAAVAGLGPCPDLRRGMVTGLACWAGQRVDGQWPIHIRALRVHDGAGLLAAQFQGGTFLPDASAVAEIGYVPGLKRILVAEIDGTIFCPD